MAELPGDVPAPVGAARTPTAAAPCRTSAPPEGLTRQAPAPLRSARAADACRPATPSRGLCRSRTAPGGQRLCRSCHGSSASFPPSLQAFGMYCRRTPASRPGLAVTGPGRTGGQEAHTRVGRGAGVGRRTAWWLGAPTPLPAETDCWSIGLLRAGLCAAGASAVEGFPWPERRRGRAEIGGRSPGLRLLAAGFPP
jgi:hypothetical protein